MTIAELSGGAAEAPRLCSPQPVVSVVLWSDRGKQILQATEGGALVWVLKRAGASLPAICGGKGVCGTCKVSLVQGWADKLPTPQKREQRLLTHLEAAAGERLSCQITLSAQLDGIEVGAPINPNQKENES